MMTAINLFFIRLKPSDAHKFAVISACLFIIGQVFINTLLF